MKRLISIFATIAMLSTMFVVPTSVSAATVITPNTDGVYEIRTADELKWVSEQVNADTEKNGMSTASYKLMNDINLEGAEWIPIGKQSVPFNGTFDGNGYRVSNFQITTPYGVTDAETLCITDNGFFGYTGTNANVSKLGISKITVEIHVHNSNNTTEGNGSGRARHMAGMVGYLQGTWTDCYVVDSTIRNTKTDCNENGNTAGFAAYIGANATVSNCYVRNVGLRSAQERIMGGFFGEAAANINKIENCYTAGVYIYRTGTSHSAVTSDAALYAFGGSTADASKFVNCYAEQGNTYDGGGKGTSTETVDKNTRGTLNQSKSDIVSAIVTADGAYMTDDYEINDGYPLLKSDNQQGLIDAAAALTFDNIKGSNTSENQILSTLTLPTSTNGYKISWASDNAAINASDGKITRTAEEAVVQLVATVSKGERTARVKFNLTVPSTVLYSGFGSLQTGVLQSHSDAQYSIVEDTDGTKMMKLERNIFVTTDAEGKSHYWTYDAESKEWIESTEIAQEQRYKAVLSTPLSDGEMEMNFKVKRGGGAAQQFMLKFNGLDNLKAFQIRNKQFTSCTNTTYYSELATDTWYTVQVRVSIDGYKVRMYGAMYDSQGRLIGINEDTYTADTAKAPPTIKDIYFVNTRTSENHADFGATLADGVEPKTTSVYYVKDFTATYASEIRETGYTAEAEYTTIEGADGSTIHFFTLNDENTLRGYLGVYSWLSDDTGFICGNTSGMFYFYDVTKKQLTYLDRATAGSTAVSAYVAGNDRVYYKKKVDGVISLWSIDPKTLDKRLEYTQSDKKENIGLEVTNDGKYTYYSIDTPTINEDDTARTKEMGRINLETDEIDRTFYYTYVYPYANDPTFTATDGTIKNNSRVINHFIINPADPDILMFATDDANWKKLDPMNDRVNLVKYSEVDGLTVDIDSSFVCHYIDDYVDGEAVNNDSVRPSHAVWSRDGKYVYLSELGRDSSGLTGERFIRVAVEDGKFKYPADQWGFDNPPGANHGNADGANEWALVDNLGIGLLNMTTGYTSTIVDWKMPNVNTIGHPYHGHAEMSASGKIGTWGMAHPDTEVLGIAWIDVNSYRIDSIIQASGNVTSVTVTKAKNYTLPTPSEVKLYVAAYDSSGRLADVRMAVYNEGGDLTQTISVDPIAIPENGYVKAMVWDGCRPLATELETY